MNSHLLHRVGFSVLAAGLLLALPRAARAQAFYSVSKSQGFFQNSSAAPVADPAQAFTFSAQAAVNTTFTLPAGTTKALTLTTGGDSPDYELNQTFTTKADLDAAFPNGTYKMSGGGIGTLSFNLATDNYPATTPQVTSGTWSNGVLVINPAQATTITFSTFGTYASAGVAGHMTAKLDDFNSNNGASIDNEVATVAVGGITPSTTPITSLTVPAGALTAGHVYEGQIQFDTITTLDTTTVSGGVAVGIFTKGLRFYAVAQAAGTTYPLPVIIAQPTNQTAPIGGKATFNLGVTIGGVAPTTTSNLSILWSFNGQQIDFNNTTKYTFNGGGLVVNNLTTADVGNYSATLIAPGGIVTTNTATLTIGAAPVVTAPTIALQPVAKTVSTGSTAVFTVAASGTPPFTYLWTKDGAALVTGSNGYTGVTGATLVIQGANTSTAGNYAVTVTNSAGAIASNSVALTVTPTADPGRITNLSVLTDVTTTVPSFTVATVVGGAGTSGTKALVVRAAGPALGALGVPGTISDPKLDLFLGSAAINSNDNWGGSADLATAMASAGGFPYPSPTSKDAAIAATGLQPGSYSVIVSGVGSATGSVIAEIYDATTGTFSPTSPRLINVSVNKQIGAGGLLTLGFTISGSTAKTVLVRAVGPGLVQFGYPTSAVLGDPQLTLYNSSSTQIAANDDWGADGQLTIVGTRVGAFSIGNNQTKDAILLMTLPPGGYTAQAKGNAGTSGTAIVEVYEVP